MIHLSDSLILTKSDRSPRKFGLSPVGLFKLFKRQSRSWVSPESDRSRSPTRTSDKSVESQNRQNKSENCIGRLADSIGRPTESNRVRSESGWTPMNSGMAINLIKITISSKSVYDSFIAVAFLHFTVHQST